MKNSLFLFSILFLPLFLSSQTIDFAPIPEKDISLLLYDVETRKEVVAINPEQPFSYASNLKLLTSAAAFKNLGGGFRFLTLFSFDKTTRTLYIKAGGDPEMVIEKLWRLAFDLRRLGVKNIKRVKVDDFLYGEKGFYRAEPRDKGDDAYLAYISPLSLNYNSTEIFIKAKEVGKAVEIFLSAPSSHFIVSNSAVGAEGLENKLVVGTRARGNKTEIIVKGSLGAARKKAEIIYKKVGSPTHYYVATLLNLMKEKESVPLVREKLPDALFSNSKNINFTYKSSPLREIIRTMNLYSSNFIADSLQFFMGGLLRGDYRQGVEILKDFAKDSLSETIDVVNGSGLGNNKNFLSAHFYLKLLQKIYGDYYGSIDFFSSLPVMGEEGTLKSSGGDDSGFIRGKTGSLTGATSLSGIMKAKSGKLYLFAFAVNNFPSKSFKPMWAFRDKIINEIWQKY